MLIVTWLFDKLGYMPKVSIDTNWPFPATAKKYTPHEFEQPAKPAAKKVAKKTVAKATTRPKKK